jgi:lipoprotein-anchoring transpeptidase ErfK/SrfK
MNSFASTCLVLAAATALAACDQTQDAVDAKPATPASVPSGAPLPTAVAPSTSASPVAQAIDAAVFTAAPDEATQARILAKAQILLDRARFSPGVIDGQKGENLRQAIAAFERANGLDGDGELDQATWTALVAASPGPVMQDYTITDDDVKGPFIGKVPAKYEDMARLDALGYADAAEGLAEKFHMDEDWLKALNPGADFAAGSVIVVARPRDGELAPVVRIEVDKAERELRAYGENDHLLAVYPATVGSTSRPAPSGEWAVNTVAPNPTWNYDPKRLTFGDKTRGKFTIAAGPNNPVGSIWIDLTKDTYGIHGSPEPKLVGKVDSHGCVRLTNWDANELGAAVKKGVKVAFVGSEGTSGKKG